MDCWSNAKAYLGVASLEMHYAARNIRDAKYDIGSGIFDKATSDCIEYYLLSLREIARSLEARVDEIESRINDDDDDSDDD